MAAGRRLRDGGSVTLPRRRRPDRRRVDGGGRRGGAASVGGLPAPARIARVTPPPRRRGCGGGGGGGGGDGGGRGGGGGRRHRRRAQCRRRHARHAPLATRAGAVAMVSQRGWAAPRLGVAFFSLFFFFLFVPCAVAHRRHCAAMRRPRVRRWARQGGPSHRWSRACVRATAGRPSAGVDPTQGQRGTLVALPARCRRRCGSAASDTAALRRQQRRAGRRCCRRSAAVSGAASAARRRSGGAVTTTRCRATRRPRAATGPHRAASSWHSERHASCGRSPGHGTRPTTMIRPYDTHTDARCARQRGHGSQTALSRRRRPRSDWCGAGGADEKKTRAHFEQKRNEKDTERGRPRAVGLPTSNLCSTKQASMYINHAHSPTRHILLLN